MAGCVALEDAADQRATRPPAAIFQLTWTPVGFFSGPAWAPSPAKGRNGCCRRCHASAGHAYQWKRNHAPQRMNYGTAIAMWLHDIDSLEFRSSELGFSFSSFVFFPFFGSLLTICPPRAEARRSLALGLAAQWHTTIVTETRKSAPRF